MIGGLNPYPDMKDSDAASLGKVPAHWEVATLRRKLRPFDGIKIGPFGSQLKLEQMAPSGYKVYGQANVIAKDFIRGRKLVDHQKFSELSSCVVLPGELLVTMMGTSGRCACVPDEAVVGIMDSHLLRLRTNENLNVRFASLLIDESAYVKEQITLVGKGSIMHGLNSGMVKSLVLAFPPLPEQTAIVRFLDHADRRIRRYIRAKQKLIALLEEQKQAIIYQAVTGQIDVRTGQPYPAYKPSGVEWLGDVPTHWQGLPLKRWVSTKITDGPHETPIFQSTEIPFMSAESMVEGRLDFSRRRGYISHEQHEIYCRKCRPQRHDVFMCKSGATTGKVAIVETDDEFSVWSPLALVRVDSDRVLPRLLFAVLSTNYVQRQIQDTWSYGTQPNLSMGAMERLFVFLPPIDEQRQILTYLDKVSEEPSNVIPSARRQIDLLREYRIRLIADVVTGKLDVREAAAALPEVDHLAAEDSLDDSVDTDAELDLDATLKKAEA